MDNYLDLSSEYRIGPIVDDSSNNFEDMNKFFKRSSTKALTNTGKQQRVLLVCIKNLKEIPLTLEFYYNLFSRYGVVNKVN